MVVVSLPPELFTRFYKELNLGSDGITTIAGHDGIERARAGRTATEPGADIRARPVFQAAMQQRIGTVHRPSAADGVDRLWAFRSLDSHGLMLITAMATSDIMAPVHSRSAATAAAALLFTAMVLGFARALYIHMKRQRELVDDLNASRHQLH